MFATGGAYIVETNKLSISNNSFCTFYKEYKKNFAEDLWLLGIRKSLKVLCENKVLSCYRILIGWM